MEQDKIGKLIAEVRKDRGLTQDDVARRLGITSQSVSKWERGVNSPDVFLLLDLCEILEISVDELLNGERKTLKDNVKKEKCLIKCIDNKSNNRFKKSIAILAIVSIILIFVIGINSIINKGQESRYEVIDKDDNIVKESLNYIKFDESINKNLLQKLFDNNESIVTKDDLSNDEKMFLVLNNYKINNKLNKQFNVRFDSLEGLVFEDNTFLNEYGKDKVHYTIQNSINYFCYKGIVDYEEIPINDIGEDDIYFYVVNAKKNDNYLIIDFRVAFLSSYDYLKLVGFYKELNLYSLVMQKAKDELDLEKEELSDRFNTFRFTLKLVENKPYFEFLERVKRT